jgi:hypothetical protein
MLDFLVHLGTAVITLLDLWGGGACDRGIPGVSCMTHWSFIFIRGSHDPVYFRAADIGFNVSGVSS